MIAEESRARLEGQKAGRLEGSRPKRYKAEG
jgi:hypothetical protein